MENLINILTLVGAITIVSIFFITMVDSYKMAKAKKNNRKNIIDNMEKIIREWEK